VQELDGKAKGAWKNHKPFAPSSSFFFDRIPPNIKLIGAEPRHLRNTPPSGHPSPQHAMSPSGHPSPQHDTPPSGHPSPQQVTPPLGHPSHHIKSCKS